MSSIEIQLKVATWEQQQQRLFLISANPYRHCTNGEDKNYNSAKKVCRNKQS